MKKLTVALSGLEFHQAVRFQSPIILADLSAGVIIRDAVGGIVGVQVHGEQDMRGVSIDNIYVKGVAMMEVLPTYTNDQLYAICKTLNAMPSDTARNIIDCLEDVGFDINYEDFRTVQSEYIFTFNHHIPAGQAERLIVRSVSHRPSFCARWGHAWNWPEEMPNGDWHTECSHCGLEKSGDMAWAENVWGEMARGLVTANK